MLFPKRGFLHFWHYLPYTKANSIQMKKNRLYLLSIMTPRIDPHLKCVDNRDSNMFRLVQVEHGESVSLCFSQLVNQI